MNCVSRVGMILKAIKWRAWRKYVNEKESAEGLLGLRDGSFDMDYGTPLLPPTSRYLNPPKGDDPEGDLSIGRAGGGDMVRLVCLLRMWPRGSKAAHSKLKIPFVVKLLACL
mmetsp:Transcript_51433/g.70062  ORF Transcript_51433/g.70062 Transcript_51433/m.70062 type:complete len:112 (-) Transcript_51433:83-418(-)